MRAENNGQIRLSQVVGTEANVKKSTLEEITAVYHAIQKADTLIGQVRVYTPKDEEGEKLPGEEVLVRVNTADLLARASAALVNLFDITATRDWGNCEAKADIVVDGAILLKAVPTTYLLFLEKQLTDLHTLVSKLPTLDQTKRWNFSEQIGLYESESTVSVRTKKIPRNHVKAEATDKHPAQVEVYTEDVPVGTWKSTFYSGAVSDTRRRTLVLRVEALQRAVKNAREEANAMKVMKVAVGQTLADFVFGP